MSDDPLPHERFSGLDYDAFRRMADDPSLSPHERSGFPDAYREGAEEAILADVEAKLPALTGSGATVADLGCGSGPLAQELRRRCSERGHELILVDSPEVLAHHEDGPGVVKVPGRFPESLDQMSARAGGCEAILSYSVLQYAFAEADAFAFVDAALTLLAPGGRLLVGDVPNASMRRRFLTGPTGKAHHREYTGRDEDPSVEWPVLPVGEIDDAVVLGLLSRARDAGFHAWAVPQAPGLPMANRREDLLFERP
jgi:SAM-dependent methyltransferase